MTIMLQHSNKIGAENTNHTNNKSNIRLKDLSLTVHDIN